MKAFPAIIFALLMAAGLIGSVFLIGGNALLNNDQTPVVNSPADASTPVAAVDAQQQQYIQQLVQDQQLVKQYQDREKQYQDRETQYQAELKQAADKLTQANQQLTQTSKSLTAYQQLVAELQQVGVIAVTSDGRVMITQGKSNN